MCIDKREAKFFFHVPNTSISDSFSWFADTARFEFRRSFFIVGLELLELFKFVSVHLIVIKLILN